MTREVIGGVWEVLVLRRQGLDDLLLVLLVEGVPDFLPMGTEATPTAGRES